MVGGKNIYTHCSNIYREHTPVKKKKNVGSLTGTLCFDEITSIIMERVACTRKGTLA